MPYQRAGTPYWWISYTDACGARIRRSAETTDFADAKAIENKCRAESHAARRKAEGAPGASFDAVLAEYLAPRLTPRTRSTTRQLAAFFAGLSVHDLAPSRVSAYITRRQADGAAAGTINKELVMLSAAINSYAQTRGIQLLNAAAGMKLPEPPGIVRYLTQHEATRLIAAASPQVADFIRVALYTGLRAEALLDLEWSDIDFARALLIVRPHPTPRAKPRPRSIPLHPVCRDALLSCQARCRDSRYVFCAEQGDGRILSFKKGFAGACRRAGIKNFRIHDLRHTYASWLVMAGVPLAEVRDLLGHASIKQTERYAHLSPENLRAAVMRLPSGA